MTPIGVIDLISFLATLAALIILWNGWKHAFQRDTKLLFAGLLVFILFYNFCLFLEWSGITKALDTLEDFIGALIPMWWAFVLYAFLREMAFCDLHQSEERLRLEVIERKQAEEELRKYRDHLEELVKERTSELEGKTAELEQVNIRLQEMDRLKSVFLASMSHELRTPLNSIIGFTGIILQGMAGEVNEEQRKQLTMVKNSANHLLSLINDLLDISKIEAGKVELSLEEFRLDDVVREVVEAFSPAVSEKGLELTTQVPKGSTLLSDKRRIKQVLMNLVSNAVKFTDQGSVQIAARIPEGENLEIRVTDTGIGIKKEDMSKLFEPFQQIDMSLTMKHKGTGLGLYLTKKLAALLGGDISAKSEYSRGSEFTFTIPLKYEEEQRNEESAGG